MEKILTSEEKIKRAEAIYMRRRLENQNRRYATVNVESKKNNFLIVKMIIQISICITIYILFCLIQNGNYVFSESFLNKANEILKYDINIKNLYFETINHFTKADNNNQNENIIENNINSVIENNTQSKTNIIEETLSATENIIETIPIEVIDETVATENFEESSSVNQMEIDATYTKEQCSFEMPVNRYCNF